MSNQNTVIYTGLFWLLIIAPVFVSTAVAHRDFAMGVHQMDWHTPQLLPNVGHEIDTYATRRGWDYLVTHLLGEEPPKDFNLSLVRE